MLYAKPESLADSIVLSVAYADTFDWPLALDELHRYLIGWKADPSEVLTCIEGHLIPAGRLSRTGDWLHLPNRATVVAHRRESEHRAALLLKRAVQYGRWLSRLPFVRMVALTGALANRSAAQNSDLDYLIVTEPGFLWIVRALALVLTRLTSHFGARICPNYLITTTSLALDAHDLYTAQELSRMVPLSGQEIYARMRNANHWSVAHLPNAAGPPTEVPVDPTRSPALQRLAERLLDSPPGRWLERWEMTRKIRMLSSQQSPATEVAFGPNICKGHFEGHGQRTAVALTSRIAALGLRIEFSETPQSPGASTEGVDILFGQSYTLRFDSKLYEAMQPYPPLGTLYAAALARKGGYSVAVFDAMLAESISEWEDSLDQHRPRYAVLFEDNFNYLSKMCLLNMRQAAFDMIRLARDRGCLVIVAGSDMTDRYEAYLAAGADYVLIGEGDATLIELLNGLEDGWDDFSHSPGLAYLRGAELVHTGRRPDIKDLDALPFPARDLIDLTRYRRIWSDRQGYTSLNLVTTRGCPFHCNWCAKPIWGQRYHSRSPQNVVAEMKQVKESYNPDHIWFADDIFGLRPGWTQEFATAVRSADALIPFKCLSRADLLLRPGEVDSLKAAGCQIVWIGAESGAQHILDAMEKGTTTDQIRQAANLLRTAGIQVAFFLQFGYPGESRADLEATLALVRECQPDDIGISVSYPLPGTKFHAAVRHQLEDKENWVDSSDLDMMYTGPFTTAFYRQLHTVVHKEFRSRRTVSRLQRGQSVTLRQIAAMLYHAATLPLARRKLDSLAALPHRGIHALPLGMPPSDAARPTPQD